MKEINQSEFVQEVLSGGKVAVDFYSTQCPPCEALAPKFESVAELYGDEVKFVKIFRQGNRELSEKLDIKGFKVDSSKAKVADKKIIERTSVPAVKLAEILAQEIKTRQGYAPNMLSALELNDTLTDFKIPLWASPYADKFESLLTSLVSNKVVKQKLPGNSYVLGSEEGFKVKEGDDAAGRDRNISSPCD